MRLFISAGEPSGDLHGANLLHAIQRREPGIEALGFGGDRLAAAGSRLLYPLCNLSVMGLRRVADHFRTFLQIIQIADRSFRKERPDAVVLIDYPGLHWRLAKCAHRLGIPVVYFVPPQLWAWGGWRVRKLRRTVDHVLCALPFETGWFAARGVNATYVGHPYFDELRQQTLDPEFMAGQREKAGAIVAVLPGSRTQEVTDNLPTFVKASERVYARCPGVRFLVAAFDEEHRGLADASFASTSLPVEVQCGRTPEIIALARVAMAVSGSVGLELLDRGLPSVVHYKTSKLMSGLASILLKVKWISLVNLLANDELLPEHLTTRDVSESIADRLVEWLTDDAAHADLTRRLGDLRRRVAEPGACDRAADYILSRVVKRSEPLAYAGIKTGSRC